MVRRRSYVLVVAGLLAASACGSEAHDAADGATSTATTTATGTVPEGAIQIVDFEFSPRQLTVARGETVTWVNQDPHDHWIVSTQPDVLDSGEMSQAQTYTHTFSQAGDYTYYCNIHNYMKATVTVR